MSVCLPALVLPQEQPEDVHFMKGAFEEVIRYCTTYNTGGIPLPLTPQQRALWQQEEKRMGSLGLRGQCLGSQPRALDWRLTLPFRRVNAGSVVSEGDDQNGVGGRGGGRWWGRASADALGQMKQRESPQYQSSDDTP